MSSINRAALQPTIVRLPLFSERIPAGFPSPATDYVENIVDLNELLVRDPLATFFLRVQGESMRDAHIADGSIVVVEAGMTPSPGDIVVAEVDGDFTLKRLQRVRDRYELHPANPAYPVIKISEGAELRVFGVVTATVFQFRR